MQSTIKDIKIRPAASVTEPVTRAEAKTWCIIDHSDDDVLIDVLITRARVMVENKTHLSLVEKTIVLVTDLSGNFKLPHGPVRTITSIERRDGYTEADQNWETLTTDDYLVDGDDFKWARTPRYGFYRITYTVGFTNAAGAFPIEEGLRTAMLEQVNWMYENRGDNNKAGKFSEQARQSLAAYIDYAHV
jgi:uncharacterized phiE125 gp8 family phage protein